MCNKLGTIDGAARISKLGTLEFFIRGENELRSPKLNNSHFSALMKRPSGEPSSWMIESTLAIAGLGPATTPSYALKAG